MQAPPTDTNLDEAVEHHVKEVGHHADVAPDLGLDGWVHLKRAREYNRSHGHRGQQSCDRADIPSFVRPADQISVMSGFEIVS